MKKLFLVLFASSFMAQTISAQSADSDKRSSISIGIKAGANFSNVYNSEGQGFVADGKFGFAGGGFIMIPIGTYIGLQGEVLFSQKGFKATGNVLGGAYNFTRTTNFLDVPIYLAIKPAQGFTILLGPQFSYLLSQTDDFGTLTVTQKQEFDNQSIRKNIFGFSGGLDFELSPVVLGVRAGYDFQKNNGDGTSTAPNYKNAWYQATVAYKFF